MNCTSTTSTSCKYTPLSLLLPHCDLVISHAGFGTLSTTLMHGLPSLLIPLGADPPENAEARLGVIVFDGDAPRMLPDRGRDWRLALFPRSAANIIETWDVVGLRGIGSNDVQARGIRLPEEHTISHFFEPALQDGALRRPPFFTLAGVPSSGSRRESAEGAGRVHGTREDAGSRDGPDPIAHDAAAQVELARAEGALQSHAHLSSTPPAKSGARHSPAMCPASTSTRVCNLREAGAARRYRGSRRGIRPGWRRPSPRPPTPAVFP